MDGSKSRFCVNSSNPRKYCIYGFSEMYSTVRSSVRFSCSLMYIAPNAILDGYAGRPSVRSLLKFSAYRSSMRSHGMSSVSLTQRLFSSSVPPNGIKKSAMLICALSAFLYMLLPQNDMVVSTFYAILYHILAEFSACLCDFCVFKLALCIVVPWIVRVY